MAPGDAVPVTLPPAYLDVRRRLARREIDLDWRRLGARKPRVWPGTLYLFDGADARRENLRLSENVADRWRNRLFFLGNNAAGLLFALDDRQRVVIVDEIELDYPTVLARDFEKLARAFLLTADDRAEYERKEDAGKGRRLAGRWKRLDDIIAGRDPRLRHPFNRSAAISVELVEIANAYLLSGQRAELLDGLRAFGGRHPGYRRWVTKMRKYAFAWGTGRG
jgi:hypothetical protein